MLNNSSPDIMELLRMYDPDCNTLKFREIDKYKRILNQNSGWKG